MSIKDEDREPLPDNPGVVQGAQESRTTSSFVEREARRQKRMLTFYLLLLLIPLILGIALLKFGRSDRQMVLDEISKQAPPIVQREVGEQIKPTVKSEVQNQISPTLGEIDGLKTRQTQVETTAGSLKTSQEEAKTALRRENEAFKSELRNELKTLDGGVNERLRKFETMDGRLTRIERLNIDSRLRNLERQIENLSGQGINNNQQFPRPRKLP